VRETPASNLTLPLHEILGVFIFAERGLNMPRRKKPLDNLTGLNALAESVPTEYSGAAKNLLSEIEFLHTTLGDLKQEIESGGAVIRTSRTVKENPALRAYNTSIMRYSQLIKQLVDMLPKPAAKDDAGALMAFLENGSNEPDN
jgi:hypothetical protein